MVNSTSGGDLAFDSEGTLFLACFSGLYKFTEFNGSNATIVRVSAENFPFQLTSMAIDREDNIYVGTNDANSNLIRISKTDGAYEIVKTYNHKINDLTAVKCSVEDLANTDTDNDGVPDVIDDFPNDPEIAYVTYTPSELGQGSFAFEDQWPIKGDYDFNDLVIRNRFVTYLSPANEGVKIDIELTVEAVGAVFENGFGFKFPFHPDSVESITGQNLSRGITSANAKGLETGHASDEAVVIAFESAKDITNDPNTQFVNTVDENSYVTPGVVTLEISFTSPMPANEISGIPFDPFIFIDQDRGREVHLIDTPPTALANQTLLNTQDDRSENSKYYVSDNNLPWGIYVYHKFRYPKEGQRIDEGYNRFVDWGTSQGSSYTDWYKDNSGYRNTSKLFIR